MAEVFTGEVVEGRGLAVGVMGDDLITALEALTGMRALPGTLNLKLDRDFVCADPWFVSGADLGADWEEKTGQAGYHLCRIMIVGEIPGLAMQAEEIGGYPQDQVEIVSPVHLRTTLGLENGDRLRFVVLPKHG